MLEIIFWSLAILLLQPYLFYPISLKLMGIWTSKSEEVQITELPPLSIIIAAYNEEAVIAERIENCFSLDYPTDMLEVLIGSDGSDDKTNEIVKSKTRERLNFFEYERQGKATTVNRLVENATGDILVFSDANTNFDKDALIKLVSGFSDENVGAICGQLKLESDKNEGKKGEGFYWKFEVFLKKMENQFGIVQGGNGAIYAIRKEYFQKLSPQTINDDFTISMSVYRFGKKMVYAEDAIAREKVGETISDEMKRHIRDSSGHFIAVGELLFLLNPFNGLSSYAYWSHRILRWIFPLNMCLIFFLNIALNDSPFYLFIFYMQILFYAMAGISGLLHIVGGLTTPFFFTYYFLLLNTCLAVGVLRVVTGKAKPTWQSTQRVIKG